jgi:hypothetical protein
MPIDPFAVLNAMLRAEAVRSSESEDRRPGEPDDDTRETAPDDGRPAA